MWFFRPKKMNLVAKQLGNGALKICVYRQFKSGCYFYKMKYAGFDCETQKNVILQPHATF
jgi:hypothetical protein